MQIDEAAVIQAAKRAFADNGKCSVSECLARTTYAGLAEIVRQLNGAEQ